MRSKEEIEFEISKCDKDYGEFIRLANKYKDEDDIEASLSMRMNAIFCNSRAIALSWVLNDSTAEGN